MGDELVTVQDDGVEVEGVDDAAGSQSHTSEGDIVSTDAQNQTAQESANNSGTEGAASGASAGENDGQLVERISAEVARLLGQTETHLNTTLNGVETRLAKNQDDNGNATAGVVGIESAKLQRQLSGEIANGTAVAMLSPDDALRYLPQGSAEYVAGYMTPFLWGIAAGFVAFLIGYVWDAFVRLLGLAKRR